MTFTVDDPSQDCQLNRAGLLGRNAAPANSVRSCSTVTRRISIAVSSTKVPNSVGGRDHLGGLYGGSVEPTWKNRRSVRGASWPRSCAGQGARFRQTNRCGMYKRIRMSSRSMGRFAIAGGAIMSISISEPGAGFRFAALAAGRSRVPTAMYQRARRRGARMRTWAGRIDWVAQPAAMRSHTRVWTTASRCPRRPKALKTRRTRKRGGREVNGLVMFYVH